MPEDFDPYHRWLGIRPEEQPADHYRLLGLVRFEDDVEVIRDAAERQMGHVRRYQLGPQRELSQRILNELGAAKGCLLDPTKKAAYDQLLQEQVGTSGSRSSPTEVERGELVESSPPRPVPPPLSVGRIETSLSADFAEPTSPPRNPQNELRGFVESLSTTPVTESPRRPKPAAKELVVTRPWRPAIANRRSVSLAGFGEAVVSRLRQPTCFVPIILAAVGFAMVAAFGFRRGTSQPENPTVATAEKANLAADQARMKAEEEAQQEKAEEEAQKMADAMKAKNDAHRKLAADQARMKAEEEAKQKKAEEEAQKVADAMKAEEDPRRKIEDEQARKAEEEAKRRKSEEARKARPPALAVAPFDAATAKQHQQAWAKFRGETVEVTISIGIKLVLLPPGEFLMGSPDSDSEVRPEEKPQHRVQITKPFYLGVYEVTQAQYEKVVGNNPSKFKGKSLPVEAVSWEDAVAFCKRLSEVAEERAAGRTYRLPTEAEWEYACRAGSTSKYSFGESEAELAEYAWYDKNSGYTTHPVGAKQANAWGLYDMHGNVWEWCQDWYGWYEAAPATDPTGPGSATSRVLRGGGWHDFGWFCRSAYRNGLVPGVRYRSDGFRVAGVRSGS